MQDNTSRNQFSNVQSVSVLTSLLYAWQTTTETNTQKRTLIHHTLDPRTLKEINDSMTPTAPQDRLMWILTLPTIMPTNIQDKNVSERSLQQMRTPHRSSILMQDSLPRQLQGLALLPLLLPPHHLPQTTQACTPTPSP